MVSFEVACNRGRQDKMRETVYIGFSDNGIFVQPCDNADGSEVCQNCCREAARRFLEERAQN